MAVAFAPEGSPEAAAAALAALGLHPSEPRALGRQLELPEGTVVPRFSLMTLPPDETPALDCFLCAHLTPELVRRPEWLAHPNGALGVNSVHLLVEDTAPLLPAYDRLFGEDDGDSLAAMGNLASVLWQLGEADEAYWLQQQVADTQRRLHGDEDRATRAAIAALQAMQKDAGF